MITLKNITKDYGKEDACTHAIRGINLDIEKGEFLGIVGSSGSGKSTLLHILGGMDLATSGEYLFQGENVASFSERKLHEFRKQNISFVFQNFALMNRYTVYENVEMPLRARYIKNRKAQVMEQLEKMGIAHLKDKMPLQLSGGQQQRCAIARALVSDTPVLLADEPTGALDQRTGNDIMNYFEEINDTGKTVILITHDLAIANRCKRIVRIEDGLLVQND
ncbi:macrolide export ATP-binding/permease protein MacB [Clostridium sp. CAG:411]|jgi:putative ABC transport system ATP-binding protein|nr:ABC transporter ATP-binding protein [Lachnospiraceae bacterium]CDE45716.1 macrolide export ATP-binding/permease protein MacB [Clostridium sp. CAG:411]